ncbi:MAG: Rieske 2Fe-2S domain-containing protein [Deltaproteobacteria bacterium]|nr:Rieske 2Fe-2S domain-containing protein [Deltaproteobacteria bacterium]
MKPQHDIDYEALVKEDRIHISLYTDPAVFSDEMDKIFHRGWVYVGHEGEVPHPGDFRLKRIGRQPVIMVRDQDGTVQLLLNRCRHRGATVCQEKQGNTRSFRCMYHGWTYQLSGELSGVPSADAYGDDFKREELGLVKVPRVAAYRGFIFGSLSPAGITLEEHLGRAAAELDLFVGLSEADAVEVVSGTHQYSYRGNWKLAAENSMDGYHPMITHASFGQALMDKIQNSPSPEQQRADRDFSSFRGATIDLGNGHVMLDYKMRIYDSLNGDPTPAVRAITPEGQAHFEELTRRFGHHRAANMLREGGTHTFIFPNLILIGIQMRVLQPLRADYTEVCLYPTLLKWLAPEVNTIRLRSHEAFFGSASFGGPDDSEIFERIQDGCAVQLEPWQLLARGLHRERHEDGMIVGDMADEVTQRGIWRQWKKVMTQGTGAGRTTRQRTGNGLARKRG